MYSVSEVLIRFVATRDVDPRYLLTTIRFEPTDVLHDELVGALRSIPQEIVEDVSTDPQIQLWLRVREVAEDPEEARFEVLLRLIDDEIYQRRRSQLTSEDARPAPYDHPALSDVTVDTERLVALSDLGTDPMGALVHNGYAFSPTPPLRPTNSQYWSTQSLQTLQGDLSIRLRLDPLLIARADEHLVSMHKMYVYGRDLDWDRICDLRGEEFARWMPDEISTSDSEFTDVIWQRRSDGVHFECEEVPRNAQHQPSRYFHAMLDTKTRNFIHSDAAVRFYEPEELAERRLSHLRVLGKVGRRVKLFRVDGPVDLDSWATLVAGAFVWNNDVQRYFRGEREFAAVHSTLFTNRPSKRGRPNSA